MASEDKEVGDMLVWHLFMVSVTHYVTSLYVIMLNQSRTGVCKHVL